MKIKLVNPKCNLCGLSCVLGKGDIGGLTNTTVMGGYESTPGNGYGALDDMTTYTFSLCEFCLDWLFSQFKLPVEVGDDHLIQQDRGKWVPAAERVMKDKWRGMKKKFFDEAERRAKARSSKKKG